MRCLSCILVLVIAAALGGGVTQAQAAVVGAAPTWPIVSAVAAPPPIPALPAAGETTPPADQISDPVTPAASCGGWYLQTDYGDRWAAGSTWWEYRCTREDVFYSNPCTEGACPAFCWYCYWQTQDWTDYFYWDGTQAVFYGEAYSDSVVWEGEIAPPSSSTAWWDAPTAQWYIIAAPANLAPTASFTFSCSGLTCAFDASVSSDGDGTPVGYSWSFGDGAAGSGATARHEYASAGTYDVTLTVTDDDGATGTATQAITADSPPNLPPSASFTFSCAGLSCSVDAAASADPDGTITAYAWKFGDGTAATGKNAQHAYGQVGGH